MGAGVALGILVLCITVCLCVKCGICVKCSKSKPPKRSTYYKDSDKPPSYHAVMTQNFPVSPHTVRRPRLPVDVVVTTLGSPCLSRPGYVSRELVVGENTDAMSYSIQEQTMQSGPTMNCSRSLPSYAQAVRDLHVHRKAVHTKLPSMPPAYGEACHA